MIARKEIKKIQTLLPEFNGKLTGEENLHLTLKFLGEVDDKKKQELFTGAKAFIFSSQDEDFGIMPIEAMAKGAPVIAYNSGGVKETVLDGKTGIFFDELTVNSLSDAIKKFDKIKFNTDEIVKHAQKFSKERFKKEIKRFVDKSLR